ncbi:YadA C-terminal domain-containing protein [Acinetobacter venetianus]|nr:YadA C-terminal domain-containing protein [Acinetobacter venetianus]
MSWGDCQEILITADAKVLSDAQAYTDHRIADLERSFSKVDQSANAGVASALAIGNLPQPTLAGKNMLSIGAANHNGEQAVAIGISTVTEDSKYVLKGGFSTNTNNDISTAVSVGIQW